MIELSSRDIKRAIPVDKGTVIRVEFYSNKGTKGKLPLYPLEGQYKRENDKKCPYVKTDKPAFAKKVPNWGDSKADDREIKTTHSILKGRLL